MEKVTYRITLDTLKNGVQKVLQGFQSGDNFSRKIEVTLVSGSTLYTIPANVTAAMYILKEGQSSPSINACEIVGNKVMYDVLSTDIDTEGIVKAQLKLIETTPGGASKVLISPMFELNVWESVADDSEAEESSTFTALENALAQAKEARDSTIKSIYIDDGTTDPTRKNLFVVEYVDGQEYTSDVLQNVFSTFDIDVEKTGIVATVTISNQHTIAKSVEIYDGSPGAIISETEPTGANRLPIWIKPGGNFVPISVGGGTSVDIIDDTETSNAKTWSSSKIYNAINSAIGGALDGSY